MEGAENGSQIEKPRRKASHATLASTTQVSVSGGGWFGKTGGDVSYVNLAFCYQDQDAAGLILSMGLSVNANGTSSGFIFTAP
jgi:hypothetical protein